MKSYNLYLSKPDSIRFSYSIPNHLRGISNIEEMRKADLERLDFELKQKNSSLEDKIKEGKIWRMKFPGMILDVQGFYLNNSGELNLRVAPIHPHRADLPHKFDKTLPTKVSPLTVNALL